MRSQLLFQQAPTAGSPLALLGFAVENIIRHFDHSVWCWRDVIRGLETCRPTPGQPRRDFVQMHELARHVLQSTETLAVAISVVDSMIEHLDGKPQSPGPEEARARGALVFGKSLLTCVHHRSRALEDRLRNEISLVCISTMQRDPKETVNVDQAFHINGQSDTLLARDIARMAQRDGSTMKGIAVLGMMFLPGTFVSVRSTSSCPPKRG